MLAQRVQQGRDPLPDCGFGHHGGQRLGDRLTLGERHHHRQRLHPEGLGDPRVGIDVDPGPGSRSRRDAAASRCRIAESGLPGSAQLAHRSMTTRTRDGLLQQAAEARLVDVDDVRRRRPGVRAGAPAAGGAGRRRRRWHGSSVRTDRWRRRRPRAWRRPVAGGPGGSWVHLHTTGRRPPPLAREPRVDSDIVNQGQIGHPERSALPR